MPDPAPIWLDIPCVMVRRARLDDLDRVRAVVHDATRRVQEKGFSWGLYFTEKGEARMLARVRGDDGAETYLATRTSDGRDVGLYTLQWHDAKHWGDRLGNDAQAGYLNMLSVHRAARGTGLGRQLLRHAESLIAASGRTFIRLYCWDGSEFLLDFYQRVGFHRAPHQPHDQDVVLWQKPVAV